jgi:hypothetical protein
MSDEILPPSAGLISMRIGQEFGRPEEFAHAVALLDRGDLAIHIPREDGPSWNTVPLVHLRSGAQPQPEEWAAANATLEKLERYR